MDFHGLQHWPHILGLMGAPCSGDLQLPIGYCWGLFGWYLGSSQWFGLIAVTWAHCSLLGCLGVSCTAGS